LPSVSRPVEIQFVQKIELSMFKTIVFLVRQGPALALLLVAEDLLSFLAPGRSKTLAARFCRGSAEQVRARILARPDVRRAIESIAKLAAEVSEAQTHGE
jgi:uncharacterized protein YjeT (DUF2065 family)